MEREKLLETGKQLAGQIYEKMGMIEQCTTIADAIKELPVCFIDGEGKVIRIEKVLSNEQMNDLRDLTIKTIIGNSREAEVWLERLNTATKDPVQEEEMEEEPKDEKNDATECGVPVIETEEPVEEPVIESNDTTEEKEAEEEKPLSSTKTQSGKQKKRKKKETEPEKESISDIQKKDAELGMTYGQYMQEQEKKSVTVKKRGIKPNIMITEQELAEMYVRKAMTVQEIADQTGTDKRSVFAKIEEYGLKEPAGMSDSERKTWAKKVMERYS